MNELQGYFEQSESITNITKALIDFHKSVPKIKKDKTAEIVTKSGGKYSYAYADLSTVLEQIQEPLNSSGLALIQMPLGNGYLMTQVSHISGEWIRGTFTMGTTPQTAQEYGSAITYQRRYGQSAVLCLDIDIDDDGGEASKNPVKEYTKTTVVDSEQYLENGVQEVLITNERHGKKNDKYWQKVVTEYGTAWNNSDIELVKGLSYEVIVKGGSIINAAAL